MAAAVLVETQQDGSAQMVRQELVRNSELHVSLPQTCRQQALWEILTNRECLLCFIFGNDLQALAASSDRGLPTWRLHIHELAGHNV